ncbi:MAG: ABC transporter permease [bacterium]|nr:ABC transporter permease [bacterium]
MKAFILDVFEAAKIAGRALRSNKIRSFLATLGIVIGVMTVVLMITIIAGLNMSFQRQLAAIGSGTLYVDRYPWIFDDDFFSYRNRPRISMKEYLAISRYCTKAKAVTPYSDTMRPVGFKSEVLSGVYIVGTTDAYLETSDVMPEVGRFISATDANANRDVVVIGTTVAEKLFKERNPIGQMVRISGHEFRVIGVLEKQGTMFGQSLDSQAIIPLGSLMKYFGRHRDVTIIVKAADPKQLDELKDELTGVLRRVRKLGPADKDNFAINEQGQLMSMYTQLTSGVYSAGIIIGGISLLVGGIGIMNIMLVSVTERTQEIGIRKALGAKKSQIMRQFLIESALICLIGGTIGVGLAWGGGKIINQWLPAVMPISVAIASTMFAALVGIFFGIFPAAKAARLDPIVALRKE